MAATIRLQSEDFDAGTETAKLTRGRTDIGAVVTFSGICREHEGGHGVSAMTLEHYPDMAEEEIARHVAARTKAGKLVSVAGGGDTVSALTNAGVKDGFTYVSTAGGAFLEWMEGKELPGVKALAK